MNSREKFYQRTLAEQIKDKKASILVCGGGHVDKEVFESCGFSNVTISNLDERMEGNEYSPYKWRYENAESLSCDNDSFDYVVIHAVIHHASLPHKLVTEMYRVAKKGVLAFESRDSILMRLLVRLKISKEYEHPAVYYNDGMYGGVNNTDIPNYVYRWTEREIEKTIQSYAPYTKHKIHYKYGSAFPAVVELEKKGMLKKYFLKVLQPLFWLFVKLFPKQQNLFAFYIEKPIFPIMLFPWLKYNEKGDKIMFCKEWGDKIYKPNIES